jgi:two-component system phosphate regulon sensor histidine kinase PhoR
MESLATEKGITLNIEAPQPALIMGDEARMMQVIINLLDNAFKYTSQGGAVTVHVQPTETQVLLTVQDTGVGIAQEHITHIFERFYRVDSARTRSAGGTGLGLAIVKWIATIHHGTITVTSQPGKGSTFRIALPKLQETPDVISSRSHKLIVNSTLESPHYVNAIEAKED